MSLEIERKFLLKPFNVINFLKNNNIKYTKKEIIQHYINDEAGRVIRLRKSNSDYFLTMKQGEGLVREEIEEEIDKTKYQLLLQNASDKKTLYKTRFIVQVDKYAYEIDQFHDKLTGLYYLEVEFKELKSATSFKLDKSFKEFLIQEVTDENNFSNLMLASNQTLPALSFCDETPSLHKISFSHSLECATTTIINSCISEVKKHQKQILNDADDIEALHQLRIKLRQILIIVKEFTNIYDEAWSIQSISEIKNIAKQTNKKRDTDVFIGHYDEYLTHLPPSMKEDIFPLEEMLLKEQNTKKEELVQLLESEQFKALLLRLQTPVFSSYAQSILIIELYQIVDSKLQNILKAIDKLDKNSLEKEFHKLRINFKELRYIVHFFEHFYPDQSKTIIGFAKELQNLLGKHQDFLVQSSYIKKRLNKKHFSLNTILACGKLVADMELQAFFIRDEFGNKYKKEFHKILKTL